MNSLLNLAPGDRLSLTAVLLVAVSALGMTGCAQEEPEHDMSSMAMEDMDMGDMDMEGMSHDDHEMTPEMFEQLREKNAPVQGILRSGNSFKHANDGAELFDLCQQ